MHQTTQSLMFLLLVWTICLAPPLSAAEATGALDPEKLAIVFQDGALEINGTLVSLPTKIENITALLGKQSRFAEKANDAYVWDELGVKVLSAPGTKTASTFSVYIRKRKPVEKDRYLPSGRLYVDSRPKSDFTGTLIIDGVHITPALKFWELNAYKTGTPFRRSYRAHRYRFIGKVKNAQDRRFAIIAHLHDDRTIRKIEIYYEQSEPDTSGESP